MNQAVEGAVVSTKIIPAETTAIVSETFKPKNLPSLPAEDLQKAQSLGALIDISKPREVLMFGENTQGNVAQFSDSLLGNTTLTEGGKAGMLLTNLKDQIAKIDPSDLKRGQTLAGRVYDMLPWASSIQQRITAMVSKHEEIKPALDKLSADLGLEQERLGLVTEQLEELGNENKKYIAALRVVGGALTLAYNQGIKAHESAKLTAKDSKDVMQIAAVKTGWDDLQRVDRRMYAIEASLGLAQANDTQIMRLRDILMYDAEALAEARNVMIPAWKTNIGLAIVALGAKDRGQLVEAFRQMTDDLLQNTGDLLVDIENQQASMQERTFVSAEVIARVNNQLATNIEQILTRQMTAKKSRDEGIKLIAESQARVLQAMKASGEKLMEATALNVSASPKTYDISAELLSGTAATN